MLVRRRPIARLAAGAAVGGAAYHAGKRRAEQDAYNEQAAAAYDATQGQPQYAASPYPPPQYQPQYQPDYQSAPPPAPAATSTNTAELEKLAALHSSGALTDEEFAAAKARVLGL
jgi:hypothetical protein